MASEDSDSEPGVGSAGSDVASTIGAQVRARRIELGLLTEALALAIGVSVEALTEIEIGQRRPTPQQLALLASKLAVSVPWFFEGMPEPQRASSVASPAAGSSVIEFPRRGETSEPDEQAGGR